MLSLFGAAWFLRRDAILTSLLEQVKTLDRDVAKPLGDGKLRLFAPLMMAMLVVSCAPTGPGDIVVCGRTGLIYGTDTRTELISYTDPVLRDMILSSSVALMRGDRVRVSPDGSVRLPSRTHGETQGLCAGESFAAQPSAAYCSGTLIDDDLVLTAAHCLKTESSCQATRFVFGYAMTPSGEPNQLTEADVYSCRRLVVSQYDERETNGVRLDFAIAQLDRPATPRQRTMPVAPELLLNPGDPVLLYGYPDGIPLKIDPYGTVLATRPRNDYFLAALDAFKGNSGSGVIGPDGRLVGVLVRGATDYFEDEQCGGCRRPQVNISMIKGGEGVNYFAPALAAMCAMRWPSPRLCKIDPVCGDGICSWNEHGICQADCQTTQCGNGTCEAGELGECPADCEVRDNTPDEWTCGNGYGASDGCDCDCGAPDPDCSGPTPVSLSCDSGESCSPTGECMEPTTPGGDNTAPPGWTCESLYKYGGGDGCDCECGLVDPDCTANGGAQPYRCPNRSDYICNAAGMCEMTGGTMTVPTAWTCGGLTYNDGSTCNCGCGAPDPDCTGSNPVAGCDAGETCSAGTCQGGTMPPPTGSAFMTFTGSFTASGEEGRHSITVPAGSPRTVRGVLTPMTGDVDIFIGGADLSTSTYDCVSRNLSTMVDECMVENRTGEVHFLARSYAAASYRLEVFLQ